MLKIEENERLTRVGAETPMGALQRRYWLPALLSTELPERDGPPVRVRILGEDLIAFRDSDGQVGFVDAFCPHRRAPMFFGRNEECGLRCVYHGWKFKRDGTCDDMPSEPPDSLFKTKVRITAYPTHEAGGIVWSYMGPPEKRPGPPDFEFLRAPVTHRHVSRTVEECNWLQALEGGIDTSHTSFIHNSDITQEHRLKQIDRAPKIDVETTPYGFRYAGLRYVPGRVYARIYQYVLPAVQIRGGITDWEGGGSLRDIPLIHGHFWVPIDDVTTNVYNFMYAYDPTTTVPEEHWLRFERSGGRAPEHFIPGTFRLKQNRTNDYLIDRNLQKTKTFTGITGINTQDFAMQEGMGPIVDRSKEHLGTSDRAIIAARQLLLEAILVAEGGGDPSGVDPSSYRAVRPVDLEIPESARWQEHLAPELLARF